MIDALLVLVCVGAAIVGGVFLAFSSFVMRALARLPAAQGVAAMQHINMTVLNPVFLGVLVGTAVLAEIAGVASFLPWNGPRSMLVLGAAIGYLVGGFGVTVACNVPRNERLARLACGSVEAATYWPLYVREWLLWNHVRTVASIVSAVCAAIALAY